MNATIHSDPLVIRAVLDRATNAGLALDLGRLSHHNRLAVYALQRALSSDPQPQPRRQPIGFAYPSGG